MRIVTGILIAAGILLAGCASVVKGTTHDITFRSEPSQAKVRIVDENGFQVFNGTTPAIVTLDKKRAYFEGKTYQVTIEKAGFKPFQVTLNTQVSAWYVAGNIVPNLIGWLLVDPLTGGMWTIEPEQVNVSMERQAAQVDDGTLTIGLIEDVPEQLRKDLVRLN